MKKFAINTRIIKRLLVTLVLSSLLIGCGGTKTVVTADDSAEYRDAISLPPLKKPANTSAVSAEESVKEEPSVSANQTLETEPEPSREVPSNLPGDAVVEAADEASSIVAATQSYALSNSQVIELDDDIARLQIDAEMDSAWEYVSENLKRSDITVHTRNKTAGRFAIGCATLPDKSDSARKRSGWSFLSKKEQSSEHCSLMLASSRSGTQVKLLDRSGVEYAASESQALFARLLNN